VTIAAVKLICSEQLVARIRFRPARDIIAKNLVVDFEKSELEVDQWDNLVEGH
jgi:hypothetical protein